MKSKQSRERLLGLLIVLCVGLIAITSYVITVVGYSQLRQQGLAGSVAVVAARGGHIEALRWMVDRGVDPNAADVEFQTLLSWTVTNGDADDVIHLIRRGADVNRRDRRGHTPLVWAAYKGDNLVLTALIRAGAIVNPPGPVTPLGAAIENGNVTTVQRLLTEGANPNGWHRGWTPLMVSAVFGRVEVARILVAAGARRELADRSGRTAAMLAKDRHVAAVLEQPTNR